jgi:hypothetical protein
MITVLYDRGNRCVNPETEKAPLSDGRTKERKTCGFSDD